MPCSPAFRSCARGSWTGTAATRRTTDRRALLLDPARLAVAPLEIVVIDPFEVRFETPARPGAVVEVHDAPDLVVARSAADGDERLRCEIVPGRYRTRVVGRGGTAHGETELDVVDAAVTVPLP